ncbi:MAG TPA: DUF4097 family beta strand repeat-containing protein [Opitutaceae bacterium]|nr:DUF4097 family beta strand repeat-containing protein [Opitutaceae bacterium]
MNLARTLCLFILASCTCLFGHAGESRSTTLAFSDPSKPGTLRIFVNHGDLRIEGVSSDNGTVTIESNVPSQNQGQPRADGLRVVSSASSFTVSEKDNVIQLDYGRDAVPLDNGTSFKIQVPHTTHIVASGSRGGDVVVKAISGDVDIRIMNQTVRLEGLSGGALVESMNGDVTASFSQIAADHPISLLTLNGEISVRLPENARANVRFRTQNGTILTDFDEDTFVTKVQSGPDRDAHLTAAHAQLAEQDARNAEQARKQAQTLAQDAHRRAREAAAGTNSLAPLPPIAIPQVPELPRLPSIPAIVGGKVITGTLNGGGPEIQIATMNGDIIVRKNP